MHRLGAAADTTDLALHMQSRDIAPDRRFRGFRELGNVLDGHHGLFLNGA